MWTVCEGLTLTWESAECAAVPVYIPRLGVQLQWAWTHQICSLFVHRPCQISPVQHSQFLLNWVKDSEISLYWVYDSGAMANTVGQASKRHPQTIFFQRPLREKMHEEQPISALKNVREFIPAGLKVSDVEKADTLRKCTTSWPWPAHLQLRVWRASTWFSLNHLPAGHHAITKACYGCTKLALYHNAAITGQQLHASGVASHCRWLGRKCIKKIVKGGKRAALDVLLPALFVHEIVSAAGQGLTMRFSQESVNVCPGGLIYTALVMHCVMCGSGHRWKQGITVPK